VRGEVKIKAQETERQKQVIIIKRDYNKRIY